MRQRLRDVVPTSLRVRLIRTINKTSGNHLSRSLYGKATYNQDGMATAHNADFMSEPGSRRRTRRGRRLVRGRSAT